VIKYQEIRPKYASFSVRTDYGLFNFYISVTFIDEYMFHIVRIEEDRGVFYLGVTPFLWTVSDYTIMQHGHVQFHTSSGMHSRLMNVADAGCTNPR